MQEFGYTTHLQLLWSSFPSSSLLLSCPLKVCCEDWGYDCHCPCLGSPLLLYSPPARVGNPWLTSRKVGALTLPLSSTCMTKKDVAHICILTTLWDDWRWPKQLNSTCPSWMITLVYAWPLHYTTDSYKCSNVLLVAMTLVLLFKCILHHLATQDSPIMQPEV